LLQKVNVDTPYDSAILLPGVYLEKKHSAYRKDTYIPMFIVALFTIVKLWNKPQSDEQIKKLYQAWWFKLLILIIQEVEIGSIMIQEQPRKNVYKTPYQSLAGHSGVDLSFQLLVRT
jgi:hypothetical protein